MRPKFLDLLFPRDERDDGFRRELQRISRTGLRAASAIAIGAPFLVHTIGLIAVPDVLQVLTLDRVILILSLGLAPFAISLVPAAQPHLRLVGILAGFLISFESAFGLMRGFSDPVQGALIAASRMSQVLLVAIAAFPLKPVQVLTMGLASTAMLASASRATAQTAIPVLIVFISALVCTVLATILYRQRASAYWARRTAEESFEELRKAQARLLVSENALSLGRFAAALSHEMNTPLGALGSSIDTLSSLVEKARSQPSAGLDEAAIEVAGTARQSLGRLRETLDRMRQVSNLDRAEVQVVNLNELWTDLVALLGGELGGKAEVKLDLKPLPPMKCRPQQLSAVFSNLLRNAAASIETRGTIKVSSDHRGADVVLEVQDDGKGIPAERLSQLFDPTFRVQGGRVRAGWGLFVSRTIITEHGGQLEISSTAGRGTIATIVLPLPLAGAA